MGTKDITELPSTSSALGGAIRRMESQQTASTLNGGDIHRPTIVETNERRRPRRRINRADCRLPPNLLEAKSIGERLVALRLNKGLTQAQVAELTIVQSKSRAEPHPLSRTAYCMYEIGGVEPNNAIATSLAKTFGVSRVWLVFGDGSPWPD